jgi:hypothetical protein
MRYSLWMTIGFTPLAITSIALGEDVEPLWEDDGLAPFVDGAAGPAFIAPERAPQLAQADMPASRFTLPETVMPADEVRYWQIRSADINNDGVVDHHDLEELMLRLGPCANGPGCHGDLNADGVIDELDIAILVSRMGERWGNDAETSMALKIGYTEDAPAALRGGLPLQAIGDGRAVSRLELTSPRAGGLRLEIENMHFGDVEVRVYHPGGTAVFGPYFADRADEDGRWWTPTIDGDTIGIELIVSEPEPGQPLPAISSVAYIYSGDNCAQCSTGPGTPLTCHNCIPCFASWQNADGRAVGAISFIAGGGCFTCSGALLNRGAGDFSPLFMTANHCISTQAQANTLEVRWLYEATGCTNCTGVPDYNSVNRNNGSLLLKRHTGTDWALLGLYDPPNIPGGAWYLGWSAAGTWTVGDPATGVHHPNASHKRLSQGVYEGTANATFCDGKGENCFSADVRNINLTNGTAEGGSSGSPIFDSERRVRGTLCGGLDGCAPTNAYYGRLDLAYTNLRWFIGDESIPNGFVYVNGSVSGDPGNNGNSERGTILNPFNTVYEATFCVRSDDLLLVSPGNYNQSMRIWRPMTIVRWGTSGEVVIGTP